MREPADLVLAPTRVASHQNNGSLGPRKSHLNPAQRGVLHAQRRVVAQLETESLNVIIYCFVLISDKNRYGCYVLECHWCLLSKVYSGMGFRRSARTHVLIIHQHPLQVNRQNYKNNL